MPGYVIQPSSGGGGGGGSSDIIMKWNETDVSQFQVAFDQIGAGGAALSVQAGSLGPALRVTFPTKADGEKATFITIPNLLTKDANNVYRYVFSFRVVGFSGTSAEWYAVGPAFLCNSLQDASFYGCGVAERASINGATRFAKVTAGALTASGGTPGWLNNYVLAPTFPNSRPNVRFDTTFIGKHAGAAPVWYGDFAQYQPTDGIDLYPCGSSEYFTSSVGAYGAGWNAETLDACGIWILGRTGTTAGQYIEFDEIIVRKHPMDRA